MIFFTYAAGVLIIVGSIFALVAAIGLLRLPDVYSRMHAATKAGTLGSGLMMIALAFVAEDFAAVTRALAGIAFIVLTGPVVGWISNRRNVAVQVKLYVVLP